MSQLDNKSRGQNFDVTILQAAGLLWNLYVTPTNHWSAKTCGNRLLPLRLSQLNTQQCSGDEKNTNKAVINRTQNHEANRDHLFRLPMYCVKADKSL